MLSWQWRMHNRYNRYDAWRFLSRPCHTQAPPPPELLPAFDIDEAMYFTDPQQLIDMFSQLEASNMFMLQANQASQDDAAVVHAR